VTDCQACGEPVEEAFRFCPWCAAPTRSKLVEFFRAVEDEHGRALRVSRYVRERHVRFSVWDETGRAEAAISIPDDEAQRLVDFVGAGSEAPTLA
jgi:hypothetical protein